MSDAEMYIDAIQAARDMEQYHYTLMKQEQDAASMFGTKLRHCGFIDQHYEVVQMELDRLRAHRVKTPISGKTYYYLKVTNISELPLHQRKNVAQIQYVPLPEKYKFSKAFEQVMFLYGVGARWNVELCERESKSTPSHHQSPFFPAPQS